MKVTLDLTRLRHEGKISQDEFDRFSRYARTDTGTLAFNLLIGLGVVAVGGAALALIPTPWTGIVIGALLMGIGLLIRVRMPGWTLLANICILVAALMFGGGILLLFEGSLSALLSVAALFMVCGVLARSGLLVTLSLLGVAAAVGSGTRYWHAGYGLSVEQPGLTILVFSGIAVLAYAASHRLRPDLERLAIIAARTSAFFVNFGFWVGSLWGDDVTWLRSRGADAAPHAVAQAFIPPAAFALGWAIALAAAGIWAARVNRRWLVNLVAVFGAIHFYTQWFEYFDATPLTILIAGLATLGIALGLWAWNQRAPAPPVPAPTL